MGLDNLKLSPFLVKEMYTNALIDSGIVATPIMGNNGIEKQSAKSKPTPNGKGPILKFLGNNKRNILILINEKEQAFLSDGDLTFLISILNACKISVEDTALVNCYQCTDAVYENLQEQFSPGIILFLGTEPQDLDFPIQIPHYHIQKYNKQQYVCAPSLKVLAADKEEKKQLWNVLKALFSIA